VRWHAILLGATFQPAELRPAVAHPIKRDYVLADFQRSARFEGVPFRPPERFPIATQNAARVFWWLAEDDPARAADWAHAGLRAYFTRGLQLDERDALRGLCAEVGPRPRRGGGRLERPPLEAAPEGRERRRDRGRRVRRAYLHHRRRDVLGQRPQAADRALARRRAVLRRAARRKKRWAWPST
jgi:hypothetical protein